MKTRRIRLAKSLFGYSETEVNLVLRQQAATNESELLVLQQALQVERTRYEQIRSRIVWTEELVGMQEALAAQLESAVQEADQTAALVQEALQGRVQSLEEEAAGRHQAKRVRIHELSDQVRQALRHLESATEQMGTVSGQNAPPAQVARGGAATAAPDKQDTPAPVWAPEMPGPVQQISASALPAAAAAEKPVAPKAAPGGGRRVLPFRTAAGASEGADSRAQRERPPTTFSARTRVAGWRPGDMAVQPGEAVAQFTLPDAGTSPEPLAPALPVATTTPVPDATATSVPAVSAPVPESPAVVARASAEPPAPTATGGVVDTGQVGTGMRNRMAMSVARMLEGKVAGQDLRDADGAVIATRGTPITPELAAQAEAAGVLPDLILHMIWPEEVHP
jgi:hypothetical protein